MEKEYISKEFEERMTFFFLKMHAMDAEEDGLMRSAMNASAIMATINAKDLLGIKDLPHSELVEKCRSSISTFLYMAAALADASGLSLNDVARDTVDILEHRRSREGEILQ